MTSPDRSRTIKGIAVTGTVLVIAYAVLAALQILVLNPLAAVPATSLEQIHLAMAAAKETPGVPFVVIVLSIGAAAATALLVLFWRGRSAEPQSAFFAYALLLMFGAPAYFIASFGAGMALADTFLISGGDYSRWSLVLYAVSAAAMLSMLVVVIADLVRSRRRERVPSAT